jgi:hypothetical protein
MAAAMQTSKCSMRTSVQNRSAAPFRSASQAVPRSRRTIVTKAAQDPVADVAKKAMAAFAAAAVALTPLAAGATEGSIMPSRNREEDKAARSFMDSQETKGTITPGRGQEDPNSGKLGSFFKAGGAAQADMRQAAGQRGDQEGPGKGSVGIGQKLQDLAGQATKGPGGAGGNEALDKMDKAGAIGSASDRSKPVSWDGAALQVNVGVNVFGRGETGTTTDQANAGVQDLKDTLTNPGQSAANAASRTQQEANRVLSNPTGGPEQSKRAAQQLSDANSEVPKALAGGAQKAKEAVTGASFNGFDVASLQHNVRFGDLQSITGAQSKKADVDQAVTASDTATGDAQTTIDKSTSGVKARAASDSAPSQGPGASSGRTGPGGAADRAEARFDSESAAGQTPKKSGNEGFRV